MRQYAKKICKIIVQSAYLSYFAYCNTPNKYANYAKEYALICKIICTNMQNYVHQYAEYAKMFHFAGQTRFPPVPPGAAAA